MGYINLLANDVWSEQDILSRGRAMVAATVSEARQDDLRTIMLGHIARMRTATQSEMGEVLQVRALTEQSARDAAAARADMALLTVVMALEAAIDRVSRAPLEPQDAQDMTERLAAGLLVEHASPEVLALLALRHPEPEPTEVTP